MQKGLPIALGIAALAVAALLVMYFLGFPGEEPAGEGAGESERATVTRITPAAPDAPGPGVVPGVNSGPGETAGGSAAPGAKAGSGAGSPAATIGSDVRAAASGKGGLGVRPTSDPRISRDAENRIVMNDAIEMSRQINQEGDAYEDVQLLNQIVALYQRLYKTVPGGSENVEVMEVLMGKNQKNVILFPKDHPDLTGEGVLLDRWGTPYFFHNISREIMDITSAGPDRLLHSADDILLGLQEMASADLGLKPEGPGPEAGVEGGDGPGVKPVVEVEPVVVPELE